MDKYKSSSGKIDSGSWQVIYISEDEEEKKKKNKAVPFTLFLISN